MKIENNFLHDFEMIAKIKLEYGPIYNHWYLYNHVSMDIAKLLLKK